jgi:hypothetical protein
MTARCLPSQTAPSGSLIPLTVSAFQFFEFTAANSSRGMDYCHIAESMTPRQAKGRRFALWNGNKS